jgi:tryptophan 2,3-dioxygenase
VRLLRRGSDALDLVHANSRMLEHLAPWDYHSVRPALGHGSGFDSPGFSSTHEISPRLREAFDRLLARRRVNVADVYRRSEGHEDLFETAERLLDRDQRLILWRELHLKLVERIIGGHVIGTQGTPVEVLGRRIGIRSFEPLWNLRNALTDEAQTSPDV